MASTAKAVKAEMTGVPPQDPRGKVPLWAANADESS
jgi:hypothetical protein